MKNVMDNRNNSHSLMASWYSYFIYLGWVNTHSFGNSNYCGFNKVDTRQKSTITDITNVDI